MSDQVTTTEGIALSLIPFYTDGGKKASYLSYITTGFSVMEAAKLAKVTLKTIRLWRNGDPVFAVLEGKAHTELREELANHLLDIEYTRNFRLIMAKDFKVLFKDATDQTLTSDEKEYLQVIRKFYTPQQLMMIKQLIVGTDGTKQEAFDFTKTVIEMRLTKVEAKGGGNVT